MIGQTQKQTKEMTSNQYHVCVNRSNLSALHHLGKTWQNKGLNDIYSRQFVNFYLVGKKENKNIPATQIIADSCVTINIAARNSVSKQLQNKWPARRGLTNLIAIKK